MSNKVTMEPPISFFNFNQNQSLKSILGGAIGNLVEWYDWFVYAVFSIYFAPAFFPTHDPTVQLLNTAGVFAIGFLMRPIGGWIFGRYADQIGRKKALTFSVFLMCTGSLIIAVTPTYESIGIFAPLFLLLARMLQGLSIGGEDGSVATYLSEIAPPNRRGLFASFQSVTITLGQVIALGILIFLQNALLTTEQLEQWGWRIPFAVGALLALVAFYLRYNLKESDIFTNQKNKKISSRGGFIELLHHRKAILRLFFITLGGTMAYYTYTTYMLKYLVNTSGFERSTATLLSFCSLFLFLFLQPFLGRLSDSIGRRPLLITFGILGTLFTIPLLNTLQTVATAGTAFMLMLAGLLIISGYTSVNSIAKAELFPTEIRALGTCFPSALITAFFGGTVEYVALYCKYIGHEHWFYWYITFCIFISLVGCYWMADPKKTSLLDCENNLESI